MSVETAASAGRSECTDPLKLAAGVLIEYADMIEEGEVHRSGPLKGRCAPAIEEEVAEYRRLAAALIARSQNGVLIPARLVGHLHDALGDAPLTAKCAVCQEIRRLVTPK